MSRAEKILRASGLAAASAALALAPALAAGPRQKPSVALASPLAEDQGTFRILLHGKQVGSEQFRIAPAGSVWIARGVVDLELPGQPPERDDGRLELAPSGAPLHYDWIRETPDKRSLGVDFRGGTVTLVLRKPGSAPLVQKFSFSRQPIVVLDNNMYHQYALLARLYDWQRGGPQQFAVLIPQDELPGTVTLQAVAGGPTKQLVVHTADLQVNLYLDSSLRLIRLDVPGSGAAIVRE
jgi:hypothetical protein